MAINVPIVSSWDGKGISKAVKDFKKLETGSQKAAFGLLNADAAARKGVATFAKFSAIGAGVVGVIGSKLAAAAYESQKVMKQTEAIIKATGGAANVTSQQVAKLAERLSMQVGVDDELIQSSANLILTFKQVQNQAGKNNAIFDRAVQASLDLGNVFGSTDAAAMQLGKALSDPVKGITALRRAGINFTDSQKEQIKTLVASGRTLDAQKLILAEVESQVGGTAAATATGFGKMKVALENVAERLGDLLLPYIERFAEFVNKSVVPVLMTFADIIGERGVGAGFEFLSGKIVGAIWNMGAFGKTVTALVGGFAALRVATVTYTAVQTAMRLASELTTNTLRAQELQAAATKTAMLAAGGLTALVTVAATAYSVYAKRKAEAVASTRNLVDALKLEGEEQKTAIDNAYLTDKTTRQNIDTLTALGYTIDDLSQYVKNGSGAVANLSSTWDKATKGVGGIQPKLIAFRDALGLSKDTSLEQVAAIRNMVEAFQKLRDEQIKQIRIQIGLAKARKDTVLATQLEQQLMGMDPSIRNGSSKATKDQTDVLDGLNDSLDTQSKTVKTAQQKFRDYVAALRGYGADQRSYTSSIKETVSAKKKLEDATNRVAAAQERFDKTIRGYGAGSNEATTAQEELDQAQRDATRASFESEKAAFAVADAERELNNLRSSGLGTPQTIREAEIALQEARMTQAEQVFALRDANAKLTTAQQNLNDVVNGASTSSQNYKDALQELNDAKADEAEVADKVADAIDREAEAKTRLAKAERDLKSARAGTTATQRKRALAVTGKSDPSVSGKRQEFLDTVNKQFGESFKSIVEYINAGKTASSKAKRKARFNEFARANDIPEMAKGGIVSKPTIALIGEKAPEAVVPLDRLQPTNTGTTIVNVTVTSADPNAVVDALRRYQYRNGSIPVRVSP